MTAEEDPHVEVSKSKTAESSTTAEDESASKSTETDPVQTVKPTFGRIIALVKGEIPLMIVATILMVFAEACSLAVPYILRRAYDALQSYFFDLGATSADPTTTNVTNVDDNIASTTISEINLWMGAALGVYILGVLFRWARQAIFALVAERLVARLRLQVYESVLRQEIGFFDENKTGEINSRLGNDTQLFQTMIAQFLPESIVGMLNVILALVLMYGINARLTSMNLGGLTVLSLIAIPFGFKLSRLSKLYQEILGHAQTRSTEALGSIRTVQSFAAEPKELKRYSERIGDPDGLQKKTDENTYSVGVKKAFAQVTVFTVVFGGAFGWLYCTLWYGFHLVVVEGTLSLGGLSAFQSYVFIIGAAIGQTVTNLTQVVTALGASGRIFYLLERKPQIKNYYGISDDDDDDDDGGAENEKTNDDVKKPAKELRKSIIPMTTMQGNIEFENVLFSYPTRPDVLVLNAFSLKLAKDTTTALVGSSGSGKSTVVSLIQRFYDIDGGKITVDGVDLTHLDIPWFRSQIGYVQQEPQLFGISIRDNLTYGLPEEVAANITQTELENACRDANAHGFITGWPDGYDTLVGERGVTLSGGQKQRICIARALLTNCRILLLDEATSALDAESESEVQAAIENAMKGRTVVVVAHRLSTIRNADNIVVMNNGKIVGMGTHDDLLETCKRYQDLIRKQSHMIRDVSVGTLKNMLPADMIVEPKDEE